MSSIIASTFVKASFQEVLDDLSSRFILNVPDEELASVERILFQVEQAFWFYEDFVRPQQPKLHHYNLKTFSAQLFRHCPLLRQWQHEHEQAFDDFMQYKNRVPVCGAILLNASMEKVLLVRGWSAKAGWGFPKGKINKDEDDEACAIREVYEETGFDITALLDSAQFLELTMKEQRIKLYIVVGVPEDFEFEAQTRQEIGKIEWHLVKNLPSPGGRGGDKSPVPGYASGGGYASGSTMGKSYSIMPFVPRLQAWIQRQKKLQRKDTRRSARAPVQPAPDTSSAGSESDVESGYGDAGAADTPRNAKKRKAKKAESEERSSVSQPITLDPVDLGQDAAPLPQLGLMPGAADALKALLGVGFSSPPSAPETLVAAPPVPVEANDLERLFRNAARAQLAPSDTGLVSIKPTPSAATTPPAALPRTLTRPAEANILIEQQSAPPAAQKETGDLLSLLTGAATGSHPAEHKASLPKLPSGTTDTLLASLVPGLKRKDKEHAIPKIVTTPPRQASPATAVSEGLPHPDLSGPVHYMPLKDADASSADERAQSSTDTELSSPIRDSRTPPPRPANPVPPTPVTPFWIPPRPHAPIPPTPTSPAVFLFSEPSPANAGTDTAEPSPLPSPLLNAAKPPSSAASLLNLLRDGPSSAAGPAGGDAAKPKAALPVIRDSSALLDFKLDVNDLLKELGD